MREVTDARFYICQVAPVKKSTFVLVDARRIQLKGWSSLDLFIHRASVGEGWIISEGRTGGQVASGLTQQEARRSLAETFSTKTKAELEHRSAEFIEAHGLSPRYSKPRTG